MNEVMLQKCRCGSMVEHQPSKLNTWVRFPSPAFFMQGRRTRDFPAESMVCGLFLPLVYNPFFAQKSIGDSNKLCKLFLSRVRQCPYFSKCNFPDNLNGMYRLTFLTIFSYNLILPSHILIYNHFWLDF